jgi:RNA polymerase sigma-70 factor (ECF subfamily)
VETPNSQPGEVELVSALRAGDERAFMELVQRHHASLVRLAQVFVGSPAVAEEVAQETWLAALEGIGRFEGRSSVRSWLFSIAANRARTRGQREARTAAFSSLQPEDEDAPAVDPSRFLPEDHPRWPGHWAAPPEQWPEERLLRQETLQLARSAIDALPPAQRQVIVLRDVEGCSAEEVCATLGISDGNQRVLLHRARSKVRAALEQHLGGPR